MNDRCMTDTVGNEQHTRGIIARSMAWVCMPSDYSKSRVIRVELSPKSQLQRRRFQLGSNRWPTANIGWQTVMLQTVPSQSSRRPQRCCDRDNCRLILVPCGRGHTEEHGKTDNAGSMISPKGFLITLSETLGWNWAPILIRRPLNCSGNRDIRQPGV